jgi:uncharacterized protein YkwD
MSIHRTSGFRSRRAFWYLVPLAALTVVGLVLGRSLLGSTSEAALASGPAATTSAVVSTTAPAPAPTAVAGTVTAAPISSRGIAKGAMALAATSSVRIKNAKPKAVEKPKAFKKSTKPAAVVTPAPAASQPASQPSGSDASAATPTEAGFAAEVLTLTNAERAKVGCGPLALNSKLNSAAQAHSADMATANYFSHTSQDGRTPFDRIRAAGYAFGAAAENIAAGRTTAAGTMDQWMNSPGHKANILNCTYVELGVGYAPGVNADYAGYWTQNFAKPL